MRRMLTQLYFYVMPVFNVDGYQFSWTDVSSVGDGTQGAAQTGRVEWLLDGARVAVGAACPSLCGT